MLRLTEVLAFQMAEPASVVLPVADRRATWLLDRMGWNWSAPTTADERACAVCSSKW